MALELLQVAFFFKFCEVEVVSPRKYSSENFS